VLYANINLISVYYVSHFIISIFLVNVHLANLYAYNVLTNKIAPSAQTGTYCLIVSALQNNAYLRTVIYVFLNPHRNVNIVNKVSTYQFTTAIHAH
jgi:hypothetical protein